MRISGGATRLILGASFCLSLMAVGCTKYASPDDLKTLEAANQAAISAEKELEKTKLERQKLEKQVTAKEAELEKAKAEFEQVKSK